MSLKIANARCGTYACTRPVWIHATSCKIGGNYLSYQIDVAKRNGVIFNCLSCPIDVAKNKREMTSIDQWRHIVFFHTRNLSYNSLNRYCMIIILEVISVALVTLVYGLFPNIIIRYCFNLKVGILW